MAVLSSRAYRGTWPGGSARRPCPQVPRYARDDTWEVSCAASAISSQPLSRRSAAKDDAFSYTSRHMDPRYRELFNAQFTQERYAWMQRELSRRLECAFEFRLAETPIFLPPEFEERLVDAAKAIVAQLSDPARIAAMKRAIPARWDTPGMDALPSFTQVDFAVVREGDAYVPKLIELQGFPSLTAFQVVQRDVWRDTLRRMDGLDRPWSCWFSGLDRDAFIRL